jgi:cytochrome c-type biogenesis protein CcmH/NrfG
LLEFTMSRFHRTILILAIACASVGSWAQTGTDQTRHHPQTMSPAEASARHSARAGHVGQMAAMDTRMKAMHDIHAQFLSAKTPDERNALMAQHMQAMRDGMETLDMMGPDGMSSMKREKHFPRSPEERTRMMEKRMEMMELMMQMAMDRMPTSVQ